MPDSLIDKPLAIHAARTVFKPLDWDEDFRVQLLEDDVMAQPLIYGAVLYRHPEKLNPTVEMRGSLSRRELLYGNYEEFDDDTGKRRYASPLRISECCRSPFRSLVIKGFFLGQRAT